MTREQIVSSIEVYASDFSNQLFDEYQCSARGDISWDELLDIGLTKVKEHIDQARKFDWEE